MVVILGEGRGNGKWVEQSCRDLRKQFAEKCLFMKNNFKQAMQLAVKHFFHKQTFW